MKSNHVFLPPPKIKIVVRDEKSSLITNLKSYRNKIQNSVRKLFK